MRIAIASSSLLTLPILERLAQGEDEVVAIITTPDAPQGRGRTLTSSDLAQWANGKPFLLYKYEKESIVDFLKAEDIDLVITLSFGKIIHIAALTIPQYGWLNIHFSQLPRWRGAAPVQRALLAGDERIGITIFALDSGMDTGPIYLSTDRAIPESATTEQLLSELSIEAGEKIGSVIEMISSEIKPEPQPLEGITYAEKLSPTLGEIDWSSSALQIQRLDRALGGNIGIFTTFRGAKLNVSGAKIYPIDDSINFTPGAPYLCGQKNQRLVISASDSLVEFSHVKPSGRAEMKSEDFLRGARISPEERFL